MKNEMTDTTEAFSHCHVFRLELELILESTLTWWIHDHGHYHRYSWQDTRYIFEQGNLHSESSWKFEQRMNWTLQLWPKSYIHPIIQSHTYKSKPWLRNYVGEKCTGQTFEVTGELKRQDLLKWSRRLARPKSKTDTTIRKFIPG